MTYKYDAVQLTSSPESFELKLFSHQILQEMSAGAQTEEDQKKAEAKMMRSVPDPLVCVSDSVALRQGDRALTSPSP